MSSKEYVYTRDRNTFYRYDKDTFDRLTKSFIYDCTLWCQIYDPETNTWETLMAFGIGCELVITEEEVNKFIVTEELIK